MAEARCICRTTIHPACPRCAPYARAAGVALAAPSPPRLPSLQVRYPEEAAMQQLWTVAEAHGWTPDMHFFPSARYRGLWGEFIRGTAVLRVLVAREDAAVSADQRLWLAALQQTGKFEVYTCVTTNLEAVLHRLTQPQYEHGNPES